MLAGRPSAGAEQPGDQDQVAASAESAVHRGELAGEPEVAAGLTRLLLDVEAGDDGPPGSGGKGAGEDVDEGGLARPVVPSSAITVPLGTAMLTPEAAESVSPDDVDVGIDRIRKRPERTGARCGRYSLKWDSYSARTLRRCRAFMMRIRPR